MKSIMCSFGAFWNQKLTNFRSYFSNFRVHEQRPRVVDDFKSMGITPKIQEKLQLFRLSPKLSLYTYWISLLFGTWTNSFDLETLLTIFVRPSSLNSPSPRSSLTWEAPWASGSGWGQSSFSPVAWGWQLASERGVYI